MEKEIELKLEMTGEAADHIEASGLLVGDPKITQQQKRTVGSRTRNSSSTKGRF